MYLFIFQAGHRFLTASSEKLGTSTSWSSEVFNPAHINRFNCHLLSLFRSLYPWGIALVIFCMKGGSTQLIEWLLKLVSCCIKQTNKCQYVYHYLTLIFHYVVYVHLGFKFKFGSFNLHLNFLHSKNFTNYIWIFPIPLYFLLKNFWKFHTKNE